MVAHLSSTELGLAPLEEQSGQVYKDRRLTGKRIEYHHPDQ